ncbi:DUF3489 domain-containing protein [Aurantimonas sp. A3-2-R12]|uniref:DUF3489 domain-containing protein n=1 Tax=Aurantimonas sp. A3-2-R12 TaxID=3114362 RepID=UPI002E18690F|nr:DUF3489 domain-containing protein [Aurantimonas sp. A3-2-R12]
MTTTTKLTDTHLVILSHAAQHPEGHVLPLPDGVGKKGGTGTRALKSLLRRQLIQEEIAGTEDQEWARAENGERLTLTITPAGLAAIGVSGAIEQADDGSAGEPVTTSAAPKTSSQVSRDLDTSNSGCPDVVFRADTKGAAIVDLLRREAGATLADLMAASGWQEHSVRGFLSGTLKKKHGLTIASDKTDGIRRYRIAS